MGYKFYLKNIFENWDTSLPILLGVFFLYSIIYLVGTLLLFPLFDTLKGELKLKILFYKILTGAISILTFYSIYITRFQTIQTPVLIISILGIVRYRDNFHFEFRNFWKTIQLDWKTFIASFFIVFAMLNVQFWKFDFFNPSTVFVWGDFSYYDCISKKMVIEHIENNFNVIPFSTTYSGYAIYHYSDIWLNAAFSYIYPVVANSYTYTYLYCTIASTIYFMGFISMLQWKEIQIGMVVLLIGFIFLFTLNDVFGFHIHKSYLPLGLMFFSYDLYMKNKYVLVIMCLCVCVLLNPLFILLFPLPFVWYFVKKVIIEQQPKSDFRKFVILKNVSFFVIGISALFFLNILFKNMNHTKMYCSLSQLFMFEKYEYINRKLLYILVLWFVIKRGKLLSKEEYYFLLILVLFYFFGLIFQYTNIIDSYEVWQTMFTIKTIVYPILEILFLYKIVSYLKPNILSIPKRIIIICTLLVICFLNAYSFYSYTLRTFPRYGTLVKSELGSVENLLSENENIGFYKNYFHSEKLKKTEYFYQKSNINEILNFIECFKNKHIWLSATFVHNRYDHIEKELKENWSQSTFYKYKNEHPTWSEEKMYFTYLAKHKIRFLITNVEVDSLPNYMQKNIRSSRKISLNKKDFHLLGF